MAGEELTQAGLNKVIWKMLAALGGKFTISEKYLNEVNDDAIKIQHDPSTKTFIFTSIRAAKGNSRLILPNLN